MILRNLRRKLVKFEGDQFRISLLQRGNTGFYKNNKDKHVLIRIETEDDGNWFKVTEFSNFWLADLLTQLMKAKEYMEINCDPDILDGVKWGYKFKEK